MAIADSKALLADIMNLIDDHVTAKASRQLEQHLNTLDTLKGKIKDFWKDDDAITYTKTLNTQIGSVRTAQDMVNTLRATYAGLQQEIKKTKAKVTIDITDISGMLKLIADSGDES